MVENTCSPCTQDWSSAALLSDKGTGKPYLQHGYPLCDPVVTYQSMHSSSPVQVHAAGAVPDPF